jgi:hypothetical protein
MLVAWDPGFFDLVPFLTCGGLLLRGRCLATNQELALLNVYGPCKDKTQFWTQLASSGLLDIPNLILGGDLNITLNADEHWGGNCSTVQMLLFYKGLFASKNLIDVLPCKIVPTWRNGRSGMEAIARRLDRFLISDSFISNTGYPSTWVEYPYFSDHAPVFLKLNLPIRHFSYPFKFNQHWLLSPDFSDLVKAVWTDPCFLSELNPQRRIVWKLKVLKARSKSWYSVKKDKEAARLLNLESEIKKLISLSALPPYQWKTQLH